MRSAWRTRWKRRGCASAPRRPHRRSGAHVPEAREVATESVGGEPLVVSVTQQGGYLVNGRELINSSPETLRAALLKEAGTNRGMRITLRADARATHQSVITAMDVLGRLGFSEVNVATVREDTAGQAFNAGRAAVGGQ